MLDSTRLKFYGERSLHRPRNGSIGTAAARVLLGAGREVHVWNRTPERAAPLLDEGAYSRPASRTPSVRAR